MPNKERYHVDDYTVPHDDNALAMVPYVQSDAAIIRGNGGSAGWNGFDPTYLDPYEAGRQSGKALGKRYNKYRLGVLDGYNEEVEKYDHQITLHMCGYVGCKSKKRRSGDYCVLHTCQDYHGNCRSAKVEGAHVCSKHKCKAVECGLQREDGGYCRNHHSSSSRTPRELPWYDDEDPPKRSHREGSFRLGHRRFGLYYDHDY